jgi:hypothetical protein
VSTKRDRNDSQVLGLLGVGFDHKDGHKRITKNEDFLLVGGSQETHESMQEIAIKFSETLKDRGKRLQDASVDEVIDLLQDATDS